MKTWYGAAGVCVNDRNEILMVKQGATNEEKRWSVPSGEKEAGETFEECCVREMQEETGYEVKVVRFLFSKKRTLESNLIEVHYFEVEVCGGEVKIQDPDQLIHEVDWKTEREVDMLDLTYPDDREKIIELMTKKQI
ncbi:ADP-ribose pyrophosphatase YjhB, NUDIX family [Oceanobacillus limi]|uniref:ADP-ribose pyrophosphatase YjhB, NUDIX family n=1 Tax=Oceanobacillus limi TaxID=930131 RepID=A0A1H9YAD9_9BACI|nr:NUDIX hydrolase [Oceanobacillus limi]SES65767.1 ADP-ribose pyrophosphatase YjhB, NUDIX family [Oceanobacillus limi]